MESKICFSCKEMKPIDAFGNRAKSKDGLQYSCKECRNGKNKLYWENLSDIKTKQRMEYFSNWSKNTLKGRYRVYKGGAKQRGISFSLTRDEFETFWQKPCSYCGDAIKSIGIDRVDNDVGYTIENCIPCCERCNKMKLQLGFDEFIEHCKRIAAKFSSTKENVHIYDECRDLVSKEDQAIQH